MTLLDSTRTQPSIDTDAFPGTPNYWFWTSSPAADDPSAAWYVYFYFGYPKTDGIGNTFSVRCVRTYRQPREPDARYEVRTHDVRDIATGLLWERAPTTHSMWHFLSYWTASTKGAVKDRVPIGAVSASVLAS